MSTLSGVFIIIIFSIICHAWNDQIYAVPNRRGFVLAHFKHPETSTDSIKQSEDIRVCTENFLIKVPDCNMKLPFINKCCDFVRECNDYILPGMWKYDLRNEEEYKAVDCTCDSSFTQCLHGVATYNPEYSLARQLLKDYYNVVKPKCFLKIYKQNCDRRFYDLQNNSFTDNDYEDRFCATWYQPHA